MMDRSPSFQRILTGLFAAGIVVGIFPWVFSFQGKLGGVSISLRSLGDVVGVGLVLFGLSALLLPKIKNKLVEFASALDGLASHEQNRLIVAAVGIYVMGIISSKLRAHAMLGTHAYDLGFFSNICWHTANGNWFFSSEFQRNFMSVHVNWILWPLALIYKFYANAKVLLIAQAVLMAAALPIFWKLVQNITGRFSAGALGALLLACSPYFNHTISNDFHPDVWQLPCLMAALLCWQTHKKWGVIVFGVLAILAKEDVSVVVCGFGVMLMLQHGWRKVGGVLFIISLILFVFHTQVFIPRYLDADSQSLLFSRYELLGKSYPEMLENLILRPSLLLQVILYEPTKYWRFFCYFLPVGGLTFLAPAFLIPPIISVLPHLLSQASTQLALADIYALPATSFVFVGGALGAMRLLSHKGFDKTPHLASALLIVAGIGVINSPRYFRNQPAARIAAFNELSFLIPPQSSLATQQHMHPHFDTRFNIQIFPIGPGMPGLQKQVLENPEFIFCDRIGNALPYNGDDLRAAIAALEVNPAYQLLTEKENFMVFKRITDEPARFRKIPA